MLKGTDAKLVTKFNNTFVNNKYYEKASKFSTSEFVICHYAGNVKYDVKGFIEKNKDTVSDLVNLTLSRSEQPLT